MIKQEQKKPPAQSTSATATAAAYLRPVPSYGRTNRALHKASLERFHTNDGQPKRQHSSAAAPTGIPKRSCRWAPKAPPPAAAAAATVEPAEAEMILFCDDKDEANGTPLDTSEPEGKLKRKNRWGSEKASSAWLAGTPKATGAVLPNNNRTNEDHNNSEEPASKRARGVEEGGSDAPTLTDSLVVDDDPLMATQVASTRRIVGKQKEPFVDSHPTSQSAAGTAASVGIRKEPFDAGQSPVQADGATNTENKRKEPPDAACATAAAPELLLGPAIGQTDAVDNAAASEPHRKPIGSKTLQPKPVGILKKKGRYGVPKPAPKRTSPDVIELLDDSSDEDITAPIPSVATQITGATEGGDPSLPAASHGDSVAVDARGSNDMVVAKPTAADQRAASPAATPTPKRADLSTAIDSASSSSPQQQIKAVHSTSAPTSESDAAVLEPAKAVGKADCLKPRQSPEYYRRVFPDDDP